MLLTAQQKEALKQDLVMCLREEKEVSKIVIFGSFLSSSDPNDMDVAVFQDSNEGYLPLALRYRKRTREIGRKIALDIVPVKPGAHGVGLMDEIEQGEVLYER